MLSSRSARRILVGVTLPVVIALVAGCSHSTKSTASNGGSASSGTGSSAPAAGSGSSGSSGAGGSSGSAAPGASGSPSSGATGGSGGGSSSSPGGSASPSGPANCAEAQLRASIDPRHIPGNGTVDRLGRAQHGVLVDFKNISTSACVITGYPGAAVVADSGKQVQQGRRTLRGALGGLPSTQNTPPQITLQPGAYVAATIEGVDQKQVGAAQAGCDDAKYPKILITAPNTTVPVPFTVGWPKCYSFDVHPVRAVSAPPA